MIRSAASKVMRVGRAAVFCVGLAVIVALVLGVATAAFGDDGDFFKVGRTNLASAISTLSRSGAGPALSLKVGSGAPLAVNSTTKVAKLNADRLDDMDSRAFAPANHNHDSSYIQQSPTSPENASIYIDGPMRTSGMLRTGSETGTSDPPQLLGGPVYDGLVVRHINSTSVGAGQVLARTDQLRLERDGTPSGLRIAWDANSSTRNTVDCMGINSVGASVNRYIAPVVTPDSGGTASVFTDAQNVVYATCSFGDSFNNRHVTQVILQHFPGDNFWVGTVISTFNQ